MTIDARGAGRAGPGAGAGAGPRAPPARRPTHDVAAYFLTLDTINFGSGWFPTLRKRSTTTAARSPATSPSPGRSPTASAPHGPWTNAELRAMRTDEVADTLGQDPRPRADGALRAGAARPGTLPRRAPRAGSRRASPGAQPPRSRARSPTAMALYDDRGFFKRAQIVAVEPRARGRRATSTTSTASRSSPTTSSPTSCAARACSLRPAASPRDRRRAPAAARPAGARDPRLRGPRLRAARPRAPG